MTTPEVEQLRQDLEALRAECAELRSLLAEVRPPSPADRAVDGPRTTIETTASRRTMFKMAAGAAAGGVAAMAVSEGRAAATDGAALIVGTTSSQGDPNRTRTTIDYRNANGPQQTSGLTTVNANIFLVRDRFPSLLSDVVLTRDASDFPSAVAGYAYRAVPNGMYGFTAVPGGYGAVAVGSGGATGVLARGARANVELAPAGSPPPNRIDAHRRGELIDDQNGDLWLCTAAGTPGTWTKIAGPNTAGAFQAIAPKRVYDSRPDTSPFLPPKARLNPGENRLIDCTLNASFVPPSAKAVVLNLTAAGPTGRGNLSVYPDGTPPPTTSTVNYTAGVNIANSTIVGCGPGAKIRVLCGGESAVDFIVDILGYFR
jgi:hypothetical protein